MRRSAAVTLSLLARRSFSEGGSKGGSADRRVFNMDDRAACCSIVSRVETACVIWFAASSRINRINYFFNLRERSPFVKSFNFSENLIYEKNPSLLHGRHAGDGR